MSKNYCESFTINGSKCSRKAITGETFCHQHKNTPFCHQHKNAPRKQKNQCDGLTKNNIRCTRMTEHKYCKIHLPVSPPKCIGLNFNLSKCDELCSGEYCDTHKYKYRLDKPDDCPICMDEISNKTEIPLECGHWIHKECLKPTNLHKCPVCRQEMKNEEVEYIFGQNHIERNSYADNYQIYMNNMVLNSINENQQSPQQPQPLPPLLQLNSQLLYNMIRELNPFSRVYTHIQELQPVSDAEFHSNILAIFNDYNNYSEFILFDRGLDAEAQLSSSSLYYVSRRDYERYLVFIDRFVRNFLINRYGNYTFGDVSRYTGIFTSNLYRRDLIYIFNHVNYNIQFPIEHLRIFLI
jgi:hypothetical protein